MNPRQFLSVAAAAVLAATPSAALQIVAGKHASTSCAEAVERQDYSNASRRICSQALDRKLTTAERAGVHVNRGIISAATERYDQAIADYGKALQLQPDLAEAYANRGNAYQALGDLAAAMDDLNRALDIGPQQPQRVYFSRAVVHEQMGEITKAYHDYKKAAELAPDWDAPRRELERFTVSPAD